VRQYTLKKVGKGGGGLKREPSLGRIKPKVTGVKQPGTRRGKTMEKIDYSWNNKINRAVIVTARRGRKVIEKARESTTRGELLESACATHNLEGASHNLTITTKKPEKKTEGGNIVGKAGEVHCLAISYYRVRQEGKGAPEPGKKSPWIQVRKSRFHKFPG